MKKLLSLLLILSMVFVLAACGGNETPAPTPDPTPADTPADGGQAADPVDPVVAFDGKIAVITNTIAQNEEEFRSAQLMVDRYGEDKIIHRTWPTNFMAEQEQMITIVSQVAADPEVKAMIFNQAVPGCNAAVDKVLEVRDDILFIYVQPQENPPDVAARAGLVMIVDELKMGPAMVQNAVAMGAEVFVHYSFPRHMSQVLLSGRRDLIIEECEKLGIEFVDATAPDPTGDAGQTGAQQFILEDVPKLVAQYGQNTAFFSTNCGLQVPLITKVVDEGAIYAQPCCPSPYHAFPSALGLESGDLEDVIQQTRDALAERGLTGRLATWPVPVAMSETVAGVEYAIKWINGEVQQDGVTVDVEALRAELMDYANTEVELTAYEEDGVTYDNFLLVFIDDYLVY